MRVRWERNATHSDAYFSQWNRHLTPRQFCHTIHWGWSGGDRLYNSGDAVTFSTLPVRCHHSGAFSIHLRNNSWKCLGAATAARARTFWMRWTRFNCVWEIHRIAVVKSGVNKRCANGASRIKVKNRVYAVKITIHECGRTRDRRVRLSECVGFNVPLDTL